MRRRLLIVSIALAVVMGAFLVAKGRIEDRGLPSEKRAGNFFDREDVVTRTITTDKVYGYRKPYDCRRTEGDHTVSGRLDDMDFICTPRLKNGDRCKPSQCAGYAVDFKGSRIVGYETFGGG